MPWYTRWRNVFRSEQLNRELEDELTHHLAETVDRLQAEGFAPGEALRRARLLLGNYSLQKENTREMNIAAWLDQTRADILYGLRQLKLSPAFTAVAVVSLALGIGANTAIFQLINSIRLKTLPVKDPQQLVALDWDKDAHVAGSWSSRNARFSFPLWQAINREQQSFSGLIAWSDSRFNLTRGGEPRFAEGMYVNGDFFRVLGVPALLGRTFTRSDDSSSCNASAVISYAFWQREFGGDPQVLGRKISLEGHSVPVIGITPPSFFGVEVGSRYDVAVPLCADRALYQEESGKSRLDSRFDWWLSAMGRLKPGWTVQRANAYMRALSPTLMRETVPAEYRPDMARSYFKNKLRAAPGATGISGLRDDYERPLWLLMAITILVLLIACANLANLLLARATTRESEIAVRLAMGASRARVVRQLLVESLLLASFGSLLGAALAFTASRALILFLGSADNPVYIDMSLDWRLFCFTAGLAVLTCVLFGLIPALRSTHLAPAAAMRSGGRSFTTSKERFSLRRALVTFQVALSLVLLIGALLFVRSFHNLLTSDPGFQAEGILHVGIDFSKAPYPKAQRLNIYRELTERLSAIPGVVSAAQVGFTPVSGSGWNNSIGPDNAPAAGSGKMSWFNRAAPGYFRTMGTRLLAGREFNDHDNLSSPNVAIVNEEFARKFFGGTNPVGHTFHREAVAGQPEPVYQIVGLVANTKYYNLREDFRPIAFVPVAQDDDPGPGANFVLRIAGSPSSVIREAKAAVAQMNPSIGIQFRPFSAELADSLLRERLLATLSAMFGLLAAVLATVGLYGVIAYMVARRRKEIGIRMALGADRARIVRLVLREAALLLLIGVSAGIVLSLWAGKLASTLLYGIKPRDPATLAAACALLGFVALAASFIPARGAAAQDPMHALRIE